MEAFDDLMRDGYVVIRQSIAPELVQDINQRIDRFKVRNPGAVGRNLDEQQRLYRVVNLHLVVDAITRLLTENRAIEVCDRFLGEQTALYTSLYYERGSEQPLHRDTPMFCTSPGERYLGVWTALDAVDDSNGPLLVVPGSHLLPAIDVQALRHQVFGDGPVSPMSGEGWAAYQDAVARQCEEAGLQAQPVHMQPGDVIVWHPQLFHGGAPHSSVGTRRSVVMHVTPKSMPVGHMDVFYGAKPAQSKAPWRYYRRGDREIARFGQVDFGHEYTRRTWFLRRA
ncbi:phytanoyl-CoA dioxygenase family protein [Stenotrophomonas sp. 59]|uniref:phytanoyl-CoA dioxygenase family protein n=1 Tax=Stenotrophomonas sp. 59 TaxID=3051120 RepID=UPI00256EDDC3|nr:phytanoyl-CoA dioxygenase family protein [Stenotrophomonas sp. 59]